MHWGFRVSPATRHESNSFPANWARGFINEPLQQPQQILQQHSACLSAHFTGHLFRLCCSSKCLYYQRHFTALLSIWFLFIKFHSLLILLIFSPVLACCGPAADSYSRSRSLCLPFSATAVWSTFAPNSLPLQTDWLPVHWHAAATWERGIQVYVDREAIEEPTSKRRVIFKNTN